MNPDDNETSDGHNSHRAPDEAARAPRLSALEARAIAAGAQAALLEARARIAQRLQAAEPPASLRNDLPLIVQRALEPLVHVLASLAHDDHAVVVASSTAWALLHAAMLGELEDYQVLMSQQPPQPAPGREP